MRVHSWVSLTVPILVAACVGAPSEGAPTSSEPIVVEGSNVTSAVTGQLVVLTPTKLYARGDEVVQREHTPYEILTVEREPVTWVDNRTGADHAPDVVDLAPGDYLIQSGTLPLARVTVTAGRRTTVDLVKLQNR